MTTTMVLVLLAVLGVLRLRSVRLGPLAIGFGTKAARTKTPPEVRGVEGARRFATSTPASCTALTPTKPRLRPSAGHDLGA
jgi:hypothetical protein